MKSGYQDKTLFKYLIYLYMVLEQRGFKPPFINVGLRDLELEDKFSVSRKTFIPVLTDLGIVVRTTDLYSYHNINIAYKYYVSVDRYLELFNSIVETKDIISYLKDYPVNVSNVNIQTLVLLSKKIDNTKWTVLNKGRKDLLTQKVYNLLKKYICCFFMGDAQYASSTDITMLESKFDNLAVPEGIRQTTLNNIKRNVDNTLKPFNVRTNAVWDEDQEAYYVEYYKNLLAQTDILHYISLTIKEVRSLGFAVNCNINISITKLKGGYKFKVSCRQSNPYCSLEKDIRYKEFAKDGITGNYDLHCAIFAVARLMNTGEFNPNWDIKSEVLRLNPMTIDGNKVSRDELKILLMRMFFKKSDADAYSHYRHALLNNNKSGMPNVNEATFNTILKCCEVLTGGVKDFYYNVFAIESLIELRSIKSIAARGCAVKNVYDCFYFNPDEITEGTVKRIVTKEAVTVYKELKNGIKCK